MPKRALIVVDVQRDFMPGYKGPLQARGSAQEMVDGVNALLTSDFFSVKVATLDNHPPGHVSFASSHAGKAIGHRIMVEGLEQELFPDHCIQGSPGTHFPEGLLTDRIDATFDKGVDQSLDSFSGFYDNAHRRATGLGDYLHARGVDEAYVCGLVTECCVRATTLDALKEGFSAVAVVADACSGLGQPADDEKVFAELAARGASIVRVKDCV